MNIEMLSVRVWNSDCTIYSIDILCKSVEWETKNDANSHQKLSQTIELTEMSELELQNTHTYTHSKQLSQPTLACPRSRLDSVLDCWHQAMLQFMAEELECETEQS